ncbi:MAG: FecR domain-containing protein [Candidatus Omnitrophica bacterium]|nr:FecR domain-containing protein [Candidatus Omnitrophota bacterium]MDD5436325.1 FecR domain-containing protein [Candidatus Omnitrophota bacterium]
MRQDRDNFDRVMSLLKKVEPSVSLDMKFKVAFGEAIARRYEETFLEKALRRIREGAVNLREALLPEPLVLVRAMASLVVVASVGIYIYAAQPSCPTLEAKTGVVMVQAMRDTSAREVGRDYRFKVGDIVTAKKGAQADIVLSNKYALRLKEGARIKIAKLTPRFGSGKADFQLTEGKVLVSVEPGFKGSKFAVDTPTATAVALGTKFSVDASKDVKEKTQINVLQGRVQVKSRYSPERLLLAKQIVTVGAGQKTEVYAEAIPEPPQRLVEGEWAQMEELYQIGRKARVVLMVKNVPDRVIQLLKPCPIYISDEKPREIPQILEKAILMTAEAVKTGDSAKHLESIKMLERIVKDYPNSQYDVQFMLYIGAYYEYLSYHKDAIKIFEQVLLKYPDSPLASMAECAIGIIYKDKLDDPARANEAFKIVLDKYPNSLEAIWIEEKLGIKRISKVEKPFYNNLSSTSGVRG